MTALGGVELSDHVPLWMLGDAGPLRAAASAVQDAAADARAVAARLGSLLTDTASVLGWRGDAADAAAARSGATATQLDRAVGALDAAAGAFLVLARALEEHSGALRSLRARRAQAIADLVTGAPRIGRDPRIPAPSRADEIAALDREIAAHVQAVDAADTRAAAQLHEAAATLTALSRLAAEDGWVATAAPAGVIAALAAHGVVDDPAQAALVTLAAALPPGPAGDARLRELLGRMSPERAAALLERHPELARRLIGAMPPVNLLQAGTPEAGLAGVLAASASLPPKDRIAAVAAFFSALPPAQARRLAVLYPGVVGNLDGAPLTARVAANRLQIAVAVDDERARHAALVLAVEGQGGVQAWWSEHNDGGMVEMAYHFDDPVSELQVHQRRIDYYERLLNEQFPNPTPGPGRPGTVGHQVLVFDPSGDGQIAEMFGPIDAQTRHVGVFVPGTTVTLASMSDYADKMHRLAREGRSLEGTYDTTTIAWLGMDAPDAVGNDAPLPEYAADGGPKLRDFVWGLGLPPHVDSTALGHSYGGATVGIADRSGLDVDRVLMIESAGAGHDVWSVADYGEAATGRSVDRYSMTAPGDPISYARVPEWVQDVTGTGHGGNPDTMPGFIRLETGRYDDTAEPTTRGAVIEGADAHGGVLTPGSTAWHNMLGVVQGRTVIPWTPQETVDGGWTQMPAGKGGSYPVRVRHQVWPYADPRHQTPEVDIP